MVLRGERLEEVAMLMEELACALRLLAVDMGPDAPPEEPAPQRPPPQAQPGNAVPIESRIVVTRVLDRHQGRSSVIVNRQGELFWNIQLDVQGREAVGPLIYKKWTRIQQIP
jgi:hypothetical protein